MQIRRYEHYTTLYTIRTLLTLLHLPENLKIIEIRERVIKVQPNQTVPEMKLFEIRGCHSLVEIGDGVTFGGNVPWGLFRPVVIYRARNLMVPRLRSTYR